MTPRMYDSFMSESRTGAADCHLLVADLFPGGGAGAASCRGLALPALETLLARGERVSRPGVSLEEWLAVEFGVTSHLAAASLRGEGIEPGSACWLRADPVHLRADRDRVLLADATCFEIDGTEAAPLIAALNGHFAEDGLEFVAPAPQRWYVRASEEARVRTTPTPEIRGRGIDGYLPEGVDGARWRRIGNEAQMLLHGHPCNEAREARGALPVNGVWFWGAGRMSEVACDTAYGAVWTSHPLAAGLAAGAGLQVHSLPHSGEQWLESAAGRTGKPQLVVLHGLREALGIGVPSWQRALEELGTVWIGPLLDGLRSGTLQALTLHGLGPERTCLVRATRYSLLKFWRRRRSLDDYAS
jgi:hypothetical protein